MCECMETFAAVVVAVVFLFANINLFMYIYCTLQCFITDICICVYPSVRLERTLVLFFQLYGSYDIGKYDTLHLKISNKKHTSG